MLLTVLKIWSTSMFLRVLSINVLLYRAYSLAYFAESARIKILSKNEILYNKKASKTEVLEA
jgi:hypothetical protein